jgi:hypothetical protein
MKKLTHESSKNISRKKIHRKPYLDVQMPSHSSPSPVSNYFLIYRRDTFQGAYLESKALR